MSLKVPKKNENGRTHFLTYRSSDIPFHTVILYIIFGFAWIYFSDQLLSIITTDTTVFQTLQTYKGFMFVVVTAFLLFILLKSRLRVMETERLKKIRSEYKLTDSEDRYRSMLDNMMEGCQIIGFNWCYIYMNDAAEKHNRCSREQLLGNLYTDMWPGIELTTLYDVIKRCMEQREVNHIEYEFTFPDDTKSWFDLSIQPIPDGVFILSIDITERKHAEIVISKLNRINRVMTNINQLIVRTRDIDEVFREACSIAVQDGKFLMAWVGIKNEITNTLDVVASAGMAEEYLESINIDFNDKARSSGPTGLTVSKGVHHFISDIENDPSMAPWRSAASKAGFKSSAAFPLILHSKVVGAFTLYAGEKNFFTTDERTLLDELAMDISFAMEVTEGERERQKVYEALQESETIFSQLMEHSPIYIFFKDDQIRSLRLSKNFETMLGKPIEAILGKTMDELFPSTFAKKMIEDDKRILKEGKQVDIEEELNGRSYNTIKFPIYHKGTARYLAGYTIDVTEKKKSESALIESMRFALATVNALSSHIAILDDKGSIITTNKAWDEFAEANGCRSANVGAGINYLSTCDNAQGNNAEDAIAIAAGIRSVISKERDEFNLEYPCHSSTEHRWFYASVTRFPGEGAVRVVISHENITRRKIIEEALRERELKYRLLADNITDVLWILDLQQKRFKYCSPSVEKLRGYTVEEILQQPLEKALTPSSLKLLQESLTSELQNFLEGKPGAGSYHIEIEQPCKDGSTVWTDISATFVRNDQGDVDVIGVSRNISERKKMELIIRDNEERYRLLFENSGEAILLTRLNGEILSANPSACSMFGRTEEEICAVGRAGLVDMNDPRLIASLKERELTGKFKGELNMLRRDGASFPAYVTSISFVDAKGDLKNSMTITDLTERKRAEKELWQSQQIYRELVNSIDGIVWESDAKTFQFSFVSEQAKRILGFSPARWIQEPTFWMDHLHPEDREQTVAFCITATKEKRNHEFEYRMIAADGRVVWLHDIVNVSLKDGEPEKLRGLMLDITSSKQAEIQLQESEERFRTIVENVRQAYFEADKRSLFTYCNPGLMVISGYTEKELIGTSSLRLVVDEHRDGVIHQYRTWINEHQKEATCEFQVKKKNGEIFWVEQISHLNYSDDGTLISATNFLRDIDERKQAEKVLRLRESYLTAIVENQPGLIWLKDNDGRYLMVNRLFAETCSKASPAELVGKTDRDIWPKELAEKYIADDKKVIKDKIGIVVEEPVIDRDITKLFETFKTPIFNDIGETIGTTGFSRDVSERKETEKQMEMLAHALRSISECVSITDMNDNIFFVNNAFCSTYGYERYEVIGKHVSILQSSKNDPAIIAEILPSTLQGGWRGELLNRRKNGQEFFIELSTSSIQNDQGETLALIGVAKDITERKKIEEVLVENELKLKNIIENSTNVFYMHDVDHTLHFLSPQITQLLGYNVEEALISWREFTTDNPVNENGYRLTVRAIETGVAQPPYELELHHKNGTKVWVEVREAPLVHEGKTVSIVGSLNDITERKRAEEILKESEKKFRSVVEDAVENIFTIDIKGHFTYANPITLQSTGYSFEELRHLRYSDLVEPKYKNAIQRIYLRQYQLRKEFVTTEFPFRTKTGDIKWFNQNTRLIIENGTVKGFFSIARDVTERRIAEEKLRESEERLRLSIQAANQGLFDLNIQTGEMIVNPEYAIMLGYDPATFVETNSLWIDRLHPDDKERTRQAYINYISGVSNEYRIEFRQKTKSGAWKWILSLGRIIEYTTNGKPLRMLGAHTDIDDIKRAEEMQVLQTTALESAANAIVITDLDGQIVWANNSFTRITGYSVEEAIGGKPSLLKSGKQTQQFYEKLWNTIKSGEVWRGNIVNKRKDGSFYDDEMTITPVRNASNVITHFVAVKQDVTDRNIAVQRMKEQAMLLDEAHEAIIVRDMDYRVMYWNKGAERLFGWLATDAIGKDFRSLVYLEKNDFSKEMEQLYKEGNFSGEFKLRTKQLQTIVVDIRFNVINDEEGNPKSILSMSNDITDKKKIEAQLLRTQRMGSLGTLAGGIAHDLNNVLAPILLAVEFLKRTYVNDSSQKILESVESSTRRGSEIVKQILTFARGVETQKILIQPRHLIKEIIGIFKQTFPRSIKISSDIPTNTWTIMGDPTHFHQLVMNLGVNARDAMPDGGSLSITASNEVIDEQYVRMNIDAVVGRYVQFSIKDTGIGMAPQIIDHIFEPFFTTKEIGKGTGLGLSTVYTIVKSHGGFIKVQSEVGKGTTFNVFLPATVSNAVVAGTKALQQDYFGKGELILVVDDEASIRDVTKYTLELYNYVVITAADGAEGVARFAELHDKVALVLTDMMMPVMDGNHLITALRRMNPDIKIIASSGLIDKPKSVEGDKNAVNGFIDKPYTAEKLMTMVSSVIKGVPTQPES
ncbi:MAG: PAS domain S-box protein [Bacteroidota bacterium]